MKACRPPNSVKFYSAEEMPFSVVAKPFNSYIILKAEPLVTEPRTRSITGIDRAIKITNPCHKPCFLYPTDTTVPKLHLLGFQPMS